MQKYDGYSYNSLCYKDNKECDKYNFLYFITNSILTSCRNNV